MKFEVKDVRPIVIRVRKTKTELTRSRAINLAKEMVEKFEEQDKYEGLYTPNYYEIYNENTKEVIDI